MVYLYFLILKYADKFRFWGIILFVYLDWQMILIAYAIGYFCLQLMVSVQFCADTIIFFQTGIKL